MEIDEKYFLDEEQWEAGVRGEANCEYNDGWTKDYYQKELEKIKREKRKEEKRKTLFGKPFWQE